MDNCRDVLELAARQQLKLSEKLGFSKSVYEYLRSEKFRNDLTGETFSGGVSIPIEGVPVDFSADMSQEEINKKVDILEKHYESQESSQLSLDVVQSLVDENSVNRWAECMALQRKGSDILGEISPSGSEVTIFLKWFPVSNMDKPPVIEGLSLSPLIEIGDPSTIKVGATLNLGAGLFGKYRIPIGAQQYAHTIYVGTSRGAWVGTVEPVLDWKPTLPRKLQIDYAVPADNPPTKQAPVVTVESIEIAAGQTYYATGESGVGPCKAVVGVKVFEDGSYQPSCRSIHDPEGTNFSRAMSRDVVGNGNWIYVHVIPLDVPDAVAGAETMATKVALSATKIAMKNTV